MGKKTLVGLISVGFSALLLFVAYFAGRYASSFDSNLCYSYIISDIRDNVKNANHSGDTQEFKKIEKLLNTFPLHGYETNCSSIAKMIEFYNQNRFEQP